VDSRYWWFWSLVYVANHNLSRLDFFLSRNRPGSPITFASVKHENKNTMKTNPIILLLLVVALFTTTSFTTRTVANDNAPERITFMLKNTLGYHRMFRVEGPGIFRRRLETLGADFHDSSGLDLGRTRAGNSTCRHR